MATLTYDATEYQEGEFSQEEQEALAVGEQLQQEQEQLLAGKFRDAEDLEQAYIELQRKLGDPDARQQVEEPQQEEVETEQEAVENFLDRIWEEAHGEYSEETLNQLSKMDPAEVAQMYLDYRQQIESNVQSTDLSPEDVSELKGVVGGEQQYENMIAWAAQNLQPQEIDMFDAVMDRGDPVSCYFAIQALAYRYGEAAGVEGELLTGTAPRQSADVFRSQAEVVRAMSDARYDNDPAYRQDVYEKLERSNLDY
jgi:hypothetical protein